MFQGYSKLQATQGAPEKARWHTSPQNTFRPTAQLWLHLLNHCLYRIPPEEQTFNLPANKNDSKYFLSGLNLWSQTYLPTPSHTVHTLSVPVVCSYILSVVSSVYFCEVQRSWRSDTINTWSPQYFHTSGRWKLPLHISSVTKEMLALDVSIVI